MNSLSQSRLMPKETRLIFQPTSVLLDKGIVRRIYEFQVRVAKGMAPTSAQIESVKILVRLRNRGSHIYITQQSAQILRKRPSVYAMAILSNMTERPLPPPLGQAFAWHDLFKGRCHSVGIWQLWCCPECTDYWSRSHHH